MDPLNRLCIHRLCITIYDQTEDLLGKTQGFATPVMDPTTQHLPSPPHGAAGSDHRIGNDVVVSDALSPAAKLVGEENICPSSVVSLNSFINNNTYVRAYAHAYVA